MPATTTTTVILTLPTAPTAIPIGHGATEVCDDGIDQDCSGADLRCPMPGDRDRDRVADIVDNCPDQFNPGQADTDGDGVGDVCDQTVTPPGCCGVGSPMPMAATIAAILGLKRRRRWS
jgi:hypothetical protein